MPTIKKIKEFVQVMGKVPQAFKEKVQKGMGMKEETSAMYEARMMKQLGSEEFYKRKEQLKNIDKSDQAYRLKKYIDQKNKKSPKMKGWDALPRV